MFPNHYTCIDNKWSLHILLSHVWCFHFQAEGGDAGLADVEEADMASSEEGDEEEEDSSGKYIFKQ
jgi:hypothetical protein